jgi:ABC-type amino acid transport substrate-binding protein
MDLRTLARRCLAAACLAFLGAGAGEAAGADLPDVQAAGVLRHLGVPYANFVSGSGDGMDVELIRRFASHLGVRYEFVETDWKRAFGDLTGRHARGAGGQAELLDETPIRGDLLANGVTILAWRRQVADFSAPTFPSGVWLVARADADLSPIRPSGSLARDIALVKTAIGGRSVLALENTCLDPRLYAVAETGAEVRILPHVRNLNEMAPAILRGDAETSLLDVPDALVALEKWPAKIKVIGPISEPQVMGVAFRKESPLLREAFDRYLAAIRADGTYRRLVEQYYPAVPDYFPEFFAGR